MSQADPLPSVPCPPSHYYMPPPPPLVVKPLARWVWIATAVALLAVIAASIPVCRALLKQWHKADPIIAGLHAKMIKGDDAGIFAASDPAYQTQVGLQKSNAIFAFVREHLGAPRSSTCIYQNVSSNGEGGAILTLTFNTAFDKGVGTETLKMHKTNGLYRMIGYDVRSPLIKDDSVPLDLRIK